MKIRNYTDNDFEMLKSWWSASNLTISEDMIPKDTTYILEVSGIPMYSACLYLMNCKAGCMIENVIRNPDKESVNGALEELTLFLEHKAKDMGYTKVVIFSYKEKVKDLYENLGFHKTLDNVTTFCKELN